jgi:hypothetical protein
MLLSGLIGLACLALGAFAGFHWGVSRRDRTRREVPSASGEAAPIEPPSADPSQSAARLLAQALRDPLQQLRRIETVPAELVARFERIGWQARMLNAAARPMQALPCSPVSLLQEAAQEVETLRLGKVQASWTLLTRQPVHVDPERTRAAFCELLAAGAALAGEEGRIGVRITPGALASHPVRVEIEIGRRGTEMDPLAARVARQLLEAQGALIEIDGPVVRVQLRSHRSEPLAAGEKT